MIRKIAAATALLLAVAAMIAGCTSAPGEPASPPTARTVATPHTASSADATIPPPTRAPTTTGPSADSHAKSAMAAYLAFTKANQVALQHPPTAGNSYPKHGDFTRYSFDPLRGKEAGYILELAHDGVAWRGTPPTPRVTVVSEDLHAAPYPTVVLADCPTAPSTWTLYYVKSGQAIPARPAGAPLPHRIMVKVIYHQGHWGVMNTMPDTTRTCSP